VISSKRRDGVEIRGFAPIGMLEQWNTGTMGDLVLSNVKEEDWDSGLPC